MPGGNIDTAPDIFTSRANHCTTLPGLASGPSDHSPGPQSRPGATHTRHGARRDGRQLWPGEQRDLEAAGCVGSGVCEPHAHTTLEYSNNRRYNMVAFIRS